MVLKFTFLKIVTTLFMVVCIVCFLLGVYLILAASTPDSHTLMFGEPSVSNRPLAQLAFTGNIAGGIAILVMSTLGFLFAGAIEVLLAIEQNTRRAMLDMPAT